MVRLFVLAAIVMLVWRLMTGRWPWQPKIDAHQRKLAGARALLGVRADADRGTIMAAHRRHIAEVHPDRGGTDARVHEADAARDLLLAQIPPVIIDHPEEPK